MLELVIPISILKMVIASVLVTFGLYRFWQHRHPRFGGMQVGFRDLSIWSFLMASAHGAGLMLLPFVMKSSQPVSAAGGHAHSASCDVAVAHLGMPWLGAAALGIHSLSYLVVMTLAAWLVYRKLNLALLRTAWFNLDWFWAGALVIAGIFVLLS